MEATMQRLILFTLFLVVVGMVIATHAELLEHDGPYGLKALVIDRNGEKVLAWKLPHSSAKLLFVGSIFDGKEDLSRTYSRKLLGVSRLKNQVTAIETNTGQTGGRLYIFFDPACESCQMLFEKFRQEPPQNCTLLWVPLSISSGDENSQALQWLATQMPEAAQRLQLTDRLQYNAIAEKNTRILRWLKATDDPISVPAFAWVDAQNNLQVKSGDELTDGRLDSVLGYLKGVKR